jgi:RHS repeat-associated protein
MSARYMNPVASRWVSSDPSGFKLINPMEKDRNGQFQLRTGFSITESMNPYSYCSNNPISYRDPTGHYEMPFAQKNSKTFISPHSGRLNTVPGPTVPTTSGGMTSRSNHNGIDIGASPGTPMVAPMSGKVSDAYYSKSAGNVVIIEHDGGYVSKFAHTDGSAEKGTSLVQGEMFAKVGPKENNGISSGPHTHWEVTKDGKQVNPLSIMGDLESNGLNINQNYVDYSPDESGQLCNIDFFNEIIAQQNSEEAGK